MFKFSLNNFYIMKLYEWHGMNIACIVKNGQLADALNYANNKIEKAKCKHRA